MKNRSIQLSKVLLLGVALSFTAPQANSQKVLEWLGIKKSTNTEQTTESKKTHGNETRYIVEDKHPKDPELEEMTFVEMLNSVKLDDKSAALIRKFQEKEGRNRLHVKDYNSKNDCTVETCRNKEVLLVTIPASKLFTPNEVELDDSADALLAPIKRYLREPDMYRVLLVMHTDNTGSEAYRDHITEERSAAVYDWFVEQGVDTQYLFPYAVSDDMPLYENNTMDNRAANRRLEIYLVPGKRMLDQAKKGRIVF